jgi:SulP family sulfate permease
MRGLDKYFPFLKWNTLISKENATKDLIAGLVGAIIVLPQGVAFATIAGMPPEYGLYAAIVPAIIAALWGSSWHLISGPTTAISLVLFSIVSPMAQVGSPEYIKYVLTITFLVGIIQLFMGWMKTGKLLNFISHTVVVGFTAGAAILIAVNQIKNFFGIKVAQGSSFIETIHTFIIEFNQINKFVFAVAIVTLLSGILIKKRWPKFPYMIPAMLIGSLLGYFLNQKYGVDMTGIKTVGALPRVLPPISTPSFEIETIKKLASPALAVTMLALTEAVAISKAVALRSGQKIDGNQEVLGQGMSNLVGSFFSAYPASGSFNRTGLNFESGARTPLSAIFGAVFLSIIILFVAPLAAFLPTAVMAAILFLVAWGLIDFHHIKGIMHASKSETALLYVTLLSTLFIELEFAIFVGVFLSIILYLRYASNPIITCCVPDSAHPKRKFVCSQQKNKCLQLAVLKIDGSIFFGSVDNLEERFNELEKKNPEQKNLLLLFAGVSLVDLVGIDFLSNIVKQKRKIGGDVFISNANSLVVHKMQKTGFIEIIGKDHIFESKPEAITEIISRLDKEKCKNCQTKIFQECK